MTFASALEYLYAGNRLRRKGWNGKEQYIELGQCISFKRPNGQVITPNHKDIGDMVIVFWGTSGHQVGWLASQADILATDWEIYRPGL